MAIQQYGLKPFIDGSIRREPDFENAYPSITGLCRQGKFAPHLEKGELIAYITAKGSYREPERHWRLVAVLTVIEHFRGPDAHDQAHEWYSSRGKPIPRNCLARGNKGVEFEYSSQQMDVARRNRKGSAAWEKEYQERGVLVPDFIVTKAVSLELFDPPKLFVQDMKHIFGNVPGTQNPRRISESELDQLLKRFG